MSVYSKLLNVQVKLKANKSQYNKFGKFYYRSCEDILESLKPLLSEEKATILITDEIEKRDDRCYVKATVFFVDCETGEKIHVTGFAREEENKKGMDGSQVTGASSSYARKYALNGLFCIDDNKDADGLPPNNPNPPAPPPAPQPQQPSYPQPEQPQQQLIPCQGCGCGITETEVNGKTWTAQTIIQNSMQKHNKPLCMYCIQSLSGVNNNDK